MEVKIPDADLRQLTQVQAEEERKRINQFNHLADLYTLKRDSREFYEEDFTMVWLFLASLLLYANDSRMPCTGVLSQPRQEQMGATVMCGRILYPVRLRHGSPVTNRTVKDVAWILHRQKEKGATF